LRKRQTLVDSNTCGFVTGSAIYCADGGACAAATVGGTLAQGCCLMEEECNWFTACYDNNQYLASDCTGNCWSNTANVVCTDEILAPYCQTYAFANGATGYGCDSLSESTATPISSSFDGYVASITFIANANANPNPNPNPTSPSFPTTEYTFPVYHTGVSTAIPAIIVLVIYGLWYLSGLIIVIMCCRRHKAFMRTLNLQPAMPFAPAPAPMGATMVPGPVYMEQKLPQSNVVMQMGAPVPAPSPQPHYGYAPVPLATEQQYYQQPPPQGYGYQ